MNRHEKLWERLGRERSGGKVRQKRLDMKGRSETVVAQGRRKGKTEKRRWEGVAGKGKGRGRKWYVGKKNRWERIYRLKSSRVTAIQRRM
jgi:hypothetical protein